MLKVTVELWPGDRESGRRVIATADIGRVLLQCAGELRGAVK